MYQKLETSEAKPVTDFSIAFVLVLNNSFLLKRELCPFLQASSTRVSKIW